MSSLEDISIWSNGGNHFRSKELLASICEEINNKLNKNVKMNYFAEYHGESLVDGHFGLISKWLKEFMTTSYIYIIDDLNNCFKEKEKLRQEMAKDKMSERNQNNQSSIFWSIKGIYGV